MQYYRTNCHLGNGAALKSYYQEERRSFSPQGSNKKGLTQKAQNKPLQESTQQPLQPYKSQQQSQQSLKSQQSNPPLKSNENTKIGKTLLGRGNGGEYDEYAEEYYRREYYKEEEEKKRKIIEEYEKEKERVREGEKKKYNIITTIIPDSLYINDPISLLRVSPVQNKFAVATGGGYLRVYDDYGIQFDEVVSYTIKNMAWGFNNRYIFIDVGLSLAVLDFDEQNFDVLGDLAGETTTMIYSAPHNFCITATKNECCFWNLKCLVRKIQYDQVIKSIDLQGDKLVVVFDKAFDSMKISEVVNR